MEARLRGPEVSRTPSRILADPFPRSGTMRLHTTPGPRSLPVEVGMVSPGLRVDRNRSSGTSLEPGPKGCLVAKVSGKG